MYNGRISVSALGSSNRKRFVVGLAKLSNAWSLSNNFLLVDPEKGPLPVYSRTESRKLRLLFAGLSKGIPVEPGMKGWLFPKPEGGGEPKPEGGGGGGGGFPGTAGGTPGVNAPGGTGDGSTP